MDDCQPAVLAAALETGAADLDGVFSSSWHALPPELARALAILAALPAAFDRRIAEAASGLRPSGFDALAARSLVDRSAEPERWRLHPLMRHWLRTHHPVPGAEAAVAEAAIAAFDAQLAAFGPDHARLLGWVGAELALLYGAFERAVAAVDAALLARLAPVLGEWFDLRGRRDEGSMLYATAARQLAGAPLAARGPIQAARARFCYRAGQFDEALLLAAASARGSPRVRIETLGVRGLVAFQRGDPDTARRCHRRALRMAVEGGVDELVPAVLNNLAIVDVHEGRLAQALAGLDEVARRADARAAPKLRVLARLNAGAALQTAGRGAEARVPLEQALVLVREHGLAALEAAVRVTLGAALLAAGEFDDLRGFMPSMRQGIGRAEPTYLIALELLEMLLCVRSGRPRDGEPAARAAWQAAVRGGAESRQAAVVLRCAEMWLALGERERPAAWLAWFRARNDQWADDQRDASELWDRLRLTVNETAEAANRAAGLTLADVPSELGIA